MAVQRSAAAADIDIRALLTVLAQVPAGIARARLELDPA